LSYRHSSYKKLKKMIKEGKGHERTYVETLTQAQQKRLIFWALHIPKGN
jgi:hypothetical protein